MSVDIKNLSVDLNGVRLLDNVTLEVKDGERVGLVGSTGSGKSMLLRAITGLLPKNAEISGSLIVGTKQVVGAKDEDLALMRGKYVGVVFQQANRALNPLLSVEQQVSLPLLMHYNLDSHDVHDRVISMLQKVGLSSKLASKRTYELSGGQQQRVGIATALITYPRLILADEPTTALDCVTQRDVLNILTSLVDDMGASMLFVTHDFSVLSHAVNRCYVLDSSRVVDSAKVKDLLENPSVKSTKQLVYAARKLSLSGAGVGGGVGCRGVVGGAAGSIVANDTRATECSSVKNSAESSPAESNSAKCSLICAKNIHVKFGKSKNCSEVLKGVDLELNSGESLAIIGGSGSGKTTLIKALLGLQETSSGSITYDCESIKNSVSKLRKESSLVFQHPFASLDPKWTVQKSVAEPLEIWKKQLHIDSTSIHSKVKLALKTVGLDPLIFAKKYPHELSGGQAQCVAIARALISNPRILVADEPMSAIDVAERMRILDVFTKVRCENKSMTCIFVSHDLGMIQYLATRVIVLNEGKVVESGRVNEVLNNPKHAYTKSLIKAATLY
ncbi:ABC transporter ATP-binding protein [Gardnerella sp. DNF00502]|uniref:ABC transporter ATP-binding protein n=1 Tax=unclassified Gardnerella TaxID=2628112 RepID=UPI000C9FAF73|nr:ABC transporter ATP-binding protein [Gardnerella sp. KA00735]PNP89954.1 ABC transporter ATP-binding protein [Gardnerella sp. KA00735]